MKKHISCFSWNNLFFGSPLDDNTPSVAVQIDDQWAYIQIEGREILNRLGGVVLPDVIVKPSLLLNSVFKGQNHA